MSSIGYFPFGQPVRKLAQGDRSPKKVFVLGVYASAVHAKWVSPAEKVLVNALAVASEPYILWTGSSSAQGLHRRESFCARVGGSGKMNTEGAFPHDKIEPVKKGQRGADILHHVYTPTRQKCGTIDLDAIKWTPVKLHSVN